jgi:formate-dependent nitrite reductase cytochrome c552 subunit
MSVNKTVIATPQLVVSKSIDSNLDQFKQMLDTSLVVGGKLSLQVVGTNGIKTVEFDIEDVTNFNMSFLVNGVEVESEEEALEESAV